MYQILGGIAIAIALLYGAYRIGTNAASGAAYSTGRSVGTAEGDKIGYARAVADTDARRDAEMLLLIARTREEAEKERREAAERIQAIERARVAEMEIARAAFVANTDRLRDTTAALLDRVRVAEAATAKARSDYASRPRPVSAVPCTAERIEEPSFTEWLFSERGGKRIVQLAGVAAKVNEERNLCSEVWPREPEGGEQ